jgi:hypothetical protein
MHFSHTQIDALPPLSWACNLDFSSGRIAAVHGRAVEIDESGLIAGAWAGAYAERAIAQSRTSVGTALRLTGGKIVAVAGTTSANPLFISRTSDRYVLSNTLSLALALASDNLRSNYPFYLADLSTYVFGKERHRHTMPTASGSLSIFYGSMLLSADGAIRRMDAPDVPPLADFATYRRYLVEETKAVFTNAADPARRVRYRSLAVLSSGYDSPAAAVIAHEAGCRDGMTFAQPADNPESAEDSGAEIGATIGLSMSEFETYRYKRRTDLPEVEFMASSLGGGQVYLAGTEDTLAGRIVVSGYGGDQVWGADYRQGQTLPFFIGGYSQNEIFLRAPALDLALPSIGAGRVEEIVALNRRDEMRPWSIGGDYDRPIPRRILEQANIPRAMFATRKRRVATDFDNFTRRGLSAADYLSPASQQAFEAWFEREQPLRPAQIKRHALLSETAGRILWSSRLHRMMQRFGISWPPAPATLLHLKVPIRKNTFLFAWAVDEQVRRYRAALSAE